MKYVSQNCLSEWSYVSGQSYGDPFKDVTLDVIFTDPEDCEQTVPAFWAGEQTWRVRYASSKVGTHRYRTVSSDASNADLHGQEGILEVTPYEGNNPLLRHGPLRVADDRRHLEHRDGTPFFWLGDTWWMCLCKRLKWPEEFKELTADRVAKGFTVIQMVAGIYPEMEPFDERGANEAGFSWNQDFSRINPAYFDMADLRIAHLVQSGLVPCISGSWGYFMGFAGREVLKRHWRYLVARYGAYPVLWCAAGEALMPYPLDDDEEYNREYDSKEHRHELRAGWSDVIRSIRSIDPQHHPVTIHPQLITSRKTGFGHDQLDDPSLIDFDMLQTGHYGHTTLTNTVDMLEAALAHEPKMPVLVGEVNYEGILESSREEMQRFHFWSCILSGAAGHTYGANGIWQLNTRAKPFGPSPDGPSWGDTAWEDAYKLPGSGQLGLAKRLLERHPWWQFEVHPEWVEPHETQENRILPYAAGIPATLRVVFIPGEAHALLSLVQDRQILLKGLEPDVQYRGLYFNPKDGKEHDLGTVSGNAQGDYVLPLPPIRQDWVVVLERQDASVV